jgi:hypothetical protein
MCRSPLDEVEVRFLGYLVGVGIGQQFDVIERATGISRRPMAGAAPEKHREHGRRGDRATGRQYAQVEPCGARGDVLECRVPCPGQFRARGRIERVGAFAQQL